ncbi:MarR family winged helix-turn-helix transcriptional regulator [Streptomyces boncukensis]|uniref:Winged helix-turn-helix transcriptional regulator n=1 Tax=Streptomyces boncukensis TaxID=2711219 RepID=A0A6G4X6L7_9ACTN|nr:MarR family winged helix-turn-helix transcriptional regulator [Streptomyces boncukensis]NGO72497.1 winged helix-turn-helix transcriptional regulator [Streptomyces boncukensis]
MSGAPDTNSPPLASGPALFRLVRVLGRKPGSLEQDRLIHIQVVQAVGDPEDPDAEVTIGSVAERLKLNPSTASRMVTDAVKSGYVTHAPSERDSRSKVLALTRAGQGLLTRSREYQQQVFDDLVAEWPDDEAREFSRLLVKFADAVERRS